MQLKPGPEPELCIWCKTATYSGRALKTEALNKILSVKNKIDYGYSHEASQLTIYNMDLILSLRLVYFIFCCTLVYVHSSFCNHLDGEERSGCCCLVVVVWLFLAVPWVCLRFEVVVFPDHTHYFLLKVFPIINIPHSRQFCSALMITFQLCHGSRELRQGGGGGSL